jgi:O-antigen/teichoic acid export membrane protein
MQIKRLVTQFFWVSGGRLIAALLQAVLLVLVARDAGPHEFGLFSATFGLATVVQTAFDLGLATLIIRERAARPNSPLVQAALKVSGRMTILSGTSSLLALAILGFFLDETFLYLLPLAVWIAAERQADTWLSVTLADGRAKVNSINLIARRSISVLAYLAIVSLSVDPLAAFAGSIALAALISAVTVRHQLALGPLPREVDMRAVVREARPYWIHSLGTQARNLDSTLVSYFAGPAQAGFYAAAGRTTGPLRLLTTSLASVFLPAAASGGRTGVRRLASVSLLVALATAGFYGVLIAFSPWIVQVLLGDAYMGAVLPLQIVLCGLPFAALASLYGSLLQGVGQQGFAARIAVITTALCLFGCVIGAAVAGANGAACALALSFIAQSLILFIRLRTWLRKRH